MTRTARTARATTSITFKQIMPAVTKAIGEDRGKDFVADPSAETADAIVEVVRANLYKLAGIRKSRKATTEEETPKVRTRKSRTEDVGDIDDEKPARRRAAKTEKTEAKPARRGRRAAHITNAEVITLGKRVMRRVKAGDEIELTREARKVIRSIAAEKEVGRGGEERAFLNYATDYVANMTDRTFAKFAEAVGIDVDDETAGETLVSYVFDWFRANAE